MRRAAGERLSDPGIMPRCDKISSKLLLRPRGKRLRASDTLPFFQYLEFDFSIAQYIRIWSIAVRKVTQRGLEYVVPVLTIHMRCYPINAAYLLHEIHSVNLHADLLAY